jgi:peptidoglycan/LPS O-acetylase OafA/YrhL
MLKSVQAGRALAALAVAAFHLSITLGRPDVFGWHVMGKLTWRGDLGVDFFFVLSGFIIIFIHHSDVGRPDRFAGYLFKRVVRLYPAYWLYLAIVCGLFALGAGNADHLPKTAGEWGSTITLVRVAEFIPPIRPAWTLFHEVAFYAVFGLLLLNRRVGLGIIAAIVVFTVLVFEYPPDTLRGPYVEYAAAYNLDFLIGIGVFYLVRQAGLKLSAVAFVAGLALFIGCFALEAKGAEFVAFPLLYALSFGGILVGVVTWEHGASRPISFGVLGLIGDASYSIYLTHEAIESTLVRLAMKTGLPAYVGPYGVYVLVYGGAIAAGCAAFLLIERPMLSFIRNYIVTRVSILHDPGARQEPVVET